MSILLLSGVNSSIFSATPFCRFSLKMSRFFCISSWKKCALCALLRVKWNSDDSVTSFQCSLNLIRSAKLCVCLFVKLRLSLGHVGPGIPGYRSSGKIRVASRRCTTVPVAPPGSKKILTPAFYAFLSALSRFFVR